MRFFTRCKILYRVLLVFCICIGVVLFLRLYPWMEIRSWDFFFICIFLFLVLCLIMLKCINRDAEEDLAAIMKSKDESEVHIGNPDKK